MTSVKKKSSPRKRKRSETDDDYNCEEQLPVNFNKRASSKRVCDGSDKEEEELSEVVSEAERRAAKRAADKELKDTYSAHHFQNDNTNSFMPYVPGKWSPVEFYRVPYDVVVQTIRENGSEGLGRAEIGHVLGYDATLKHGGRRVSMFISTCVTENPDHIGQFQKMDGKIRTIRYYWKENETPEKFAILLNEFEVLSGTKCPFKIGEVIKFPEKKLNTLRISDVTLKRLNRIIKMTNTYRSIVTYHRIIKIISEEEAAEGYKYLIDKKSLMKCILALKAKKLVNFWETTVKSDSINHNVVLLAHRDITSVEHKDVTSSIQNILDEFQRQGRVFPHGQLRTLKKIPAGPKNEFDESLESINDDMNRKITIKDRFHFFRLQAVRNCWKPSEAANKSIDEENHEENDKEVQEEIESVSTTPRVNSVRGHQYYFGRDSLGYQNKANRLYIAHEMAFHFVYGHPPKTEPNAFKIFPPAQPFSSWPVTNNPHVFCNNESPRRYVPPHPNYDHIQNGWFMIQDFLAITPLSILILIVYIPRKIMKDVLNSYLEDPLKRHLCVGYLDKETREILLKEKKIYKQLEHIFCTLGAMGLVALGKNPSPKRFPSASSTMVFIGRKAILYDTSTSEKGYACVSPPISQYEKYEYEFNEIGDVYLYWHNLRAIVQSTPLSFRMDDSQDSTASRCRQYTIGVFDKKTIEFDMDMLIDNLEPSPPNDGVAGFDSAMFMHLRRNWDLIPQPYNLVNWYVQAYRKNADSLRSRIEKRVKRLQKDWNSLVRSLVPSDMNVKKTKMEKLFTIDDSNGDFSSKKGAVKREIAPDELLGGSIVPKCVTKKKRKPDLVDVVSSRGRLNSRCRFTSKERDQLILIRAVGFFLNPVYRFWLDPAVLRDLMHEYVPESRNKTVQSLMACGVRELVRPNRLAYLQRVVRSLSTFPEMRNLRYGLCSSKSTADVSGKTEFFKDAFRTAMKLLFMDNNRTPHYSVSDNEFEKFLKDSNVEVTKEVSVNNSLPYRSKAPESIEHIQHCVTTNILLSVLIHSTNNLISGSILDQTAPDVVHEVLQTMRTDGLIAKTRSNDTNDVSTKNLASLSYYFRHFFSHRYHSDLIDEVGELFEDIDEGNRDEMLELEGDSPSVVLSAACTFVDSGYSVELSVDDDILDAFKQMDEEQITKKIRYLEAANLHLEKVRVYVESSEEQKEDMFSLTSVLTAMDKSRPVIREYTSFECWLEKFNVAKRRQLRSIMSTVKQSKHYGVKFDEIAGKVRIGKEQLAKCLEEMRTGGHVFEAGVDDIRWVAVEYENPWIIVCNGRKFCPRPWIKADGVICFPTIRWMSEAILMHTCTKYGIMLKELQFSFEFAIQPIVIRELLDLLEKAKCVEIVEKEIRSMRRENPFSPSSKKEKITYIVPTSDAIERFSRIFHGISYLPTMLSRS